MNISRTGRLTFTTLSLALVSAPVLSQDGPGLVGTLSINEQLSLESNADLIATPVDPKVISTTGLNFGLTSETRTEILRFNIGGEFSGAFGAGATSADDLEFKNENASVFYLRDGANSSLSFDAAYSSFDISDTVQGFFVDGVFDPDALVIDGGQRNLTRMSARYIVGKDAPLEFDIRVSNRDVEYVGTTDPDLISNVSKDIDAIATFRLNPALSARALVGYTDTDNDDATDTNRRDTYIGFGATGELNGGLSYSADITLDKSETFELGALVAESDGVGISLNATQERPNGSYGFGISSRVDSSGRRTEANLNRVLDLRDGSISLSLGIADQEGADPEITTSVSYVREGSDSLFQADIVQKPSTDDGNAFLNTSIQINYEQTINSISSWDAQFSYGSATQFGTSDADTRATATLGYNRELTEDWSLRAGLEHVRIEESGAADRSSNSVFVNVGRDFTFGF